MGSKGRSGKGHKCPLPEEKGNANGKGFKGTPPSSKVIGFYSDRAERRYCEFSNFYSRAPPYEFTLPDFARRAGFAEVVTCEFSEKAVMLCKAALMGDKASFREIAKAPDPKTAKALGRGVYPWDQEKWEEHLEEVAFEVVRQKFAACGRLREVLLSTGNAILAEATRNDCIWGIGINLGDDGVNDPSRWRGRNVLGYALMRAREHLRDEAAAPAASAARGASSSSAGPDGRGAGRDGAASSAAAEQSGAVAVNDGSSPPEGGGSGGAGEVAPVGAGAAGAGEAARAQEAQLTLQAADFPSLGQTQVRKAQWPRAIAPPTLSLQVRGEETISASAHDAEPSQLTTTRPSGHKGRRRWGKLAI